MLVVVPYQINNLSLTYVETRNDLVRKGKRFSGFKMKLFGLIFSILCLSRNVSKVRADGGDDCSPGDQTCMWGKEKIEEEAEYNDDDTSEEEDEGETCFNVADDCESRALDDGCILNFANMSDECELTCNFCARDYTMLHISNAYSLTPQLLYEDKSLEEFVTKIDEYVYETIYRGVYPDHVKLHCKNKDPQCSYWAHDGECERNPEFMAERCPAACMDCESSYSARCPFDLETPGIWKAGDLNAMFTHIANSPETAVYNPTVISRPISNPSPKFYKADGPWIVLLEEFLSEEETEAILEIVEDTEYESVTEENDLYDMLFCDDMCSESEIVTSVEERLASLTGVPAQHNEVFTFFKYGEGSFHGLKSDYEPMELSFAQGPRILTVTIFLNDIPQQEDDVDNENRNGGLYFEPIESVSTVARADSICHDFDCVLLNCLSLLTFYS